MTKEDVIVAFITSVIPNKYSDTDLIFDVSRKGFIKSGLKKKSIIKLDKLVTLNKNIFTGELGEFDRDTIKEMNDKLLIALDLK